MTERNLSVWKWGVRILLFSVLGLLIFSYTQVDLNLTLSSAQIYQAVQKQLLYFGYFQRPWSAGVLTLLLVVLFMVYSQVLGLVIREKLTTGQFYRFIGTSSLLIFAYSAFSHDIFNYMFDARIVTKYHLSPYFFKALDFPSDTWTRFMHWTHRYYPYGPVWLTLTLIPSYLGLGKFVLTLALFKLFFLVGHVLNIYLIGKILGKTKPKAKIVGMVFYALNPLILIESLVSPHNEVWMLTGMLVAIYLLLREKRWWSILGLLLSGGIKFLSWILIPLWLTKHEHRKFFLSSLILYSIALIPIVLWREAYGWYLIPVLGLTALNLGQKWPVVISLGLASGTLLRYIPYFYYGEYSSTTQSWQLWLFICGVIAGSWWGFRLWEKLKHLV